MKHLGIDLGERNIGLALSDKKGIVAEPFKIIKRKSDSDVINKIQSITTEMNVEKLVVGIPLSAEKSRQNKYKAFAQQLRERLEIPMEFWDESFSTKRAQNVVAFLGEVQKRKRTQTHRDDVAAAFILQEYLDHEKNL
jgi:putative Holliday junction resolvase